MLKKAFMSALVLAHPGPTRPFQVETDASNFTIRSVLSQPNDASTLQPMAYYSRKFIAPEINYPFHNKELMAIISAFF